MHPGGVIAFRDKRTLVLAVVRKDEGKVLRVTSEKGKDFPYPKERVALDLGGTRDLAMGPAAVREELQGIRRQADAAREKIDLELLWETVREDLAEGGTLQELARLYFGDEVSPIQTLGLLLAIEADSAYFRRKGENLTPKDAAAVQETLRQQDEAARRERERGEAVAWLRDCLGGRERPRPPGGEALVELLIRGACMGEEMPDHGALQDLLGELGEAAAGGAFDVLVRLGIFSPDENLAVHAHQVLVDFPEDVLAEAAGLAAEVREEPRRDLRELETLSIDDAETTEVDDALSLEDLGDGRVRAWIHIADVAAYVPKGSLTDRHALRRATTVYTPDRTIPMLPEVLSMGECSLQEGEERNALSVGVVLSHEAEILEHEFCATRIRVDRAWTYEECETGVDAPGLLGRLYQLSCALRARREADGAQSYERQELRIKVDEDGHIEVRKVVGDSKGQVLVSEMMVLANRVTGEALKQAEIPALFKRQLRPKEEAGGFIPKSSMGVEPGEHYGLAVPAYCQMTSPIRRYGDLAMHRQLGALIGRPVEAHSAEELLTVLASCQEREMAAGAVQKEGHRYWLLVHLSRQEVRDVVAVVGSTRRGGLVGVRLEDTLLPCMLPTPQGKSLKEAERLLVRITQVDPRHGKVRLRYLEHLPTDVDQVLAKAAPPAQPGV